MQVVFVLINGEVGPSCTATTSASSLACLMIMAHREQRCKWDKFAIYAQSWTPVSFIDMEICLPSAMSASMGSDLEALVPFPTTMRA